MDTEITKCYSSFDFVFNHLKMSISLVAHSPHLAHRQQQQQLGGAGIRLGGLATSTGLPGTQGGAQGAPGDPGWRPPLSHLPPSPIPPPHSVFTLLPPKTPEGKVFLKPQIGFSAILLKFAAIIVKERPLIGH